MIDLAKNTLKIKNMDVIKIGMDIGGSLTKLAVALSKDSNTGLNLRNVFNSEMDFAEEIELEENFLYLKNFQTSKFSTETIEFLKKLNSFQKLSNIYATGGGAYKFFDIISEEFKINLDKHDELLSLVRGYIMMNNYQSFYEIKGSGGEYTLLSPEDLEYPHLAVNVGSGVSVLQVNNSNDIMRVTGTLMGGGTLIGLSKLLIDVENYNDIMKLAEKGDNTHLDLLVKDIYGTSRSSTSNINLEQDTIASSFGKIHQLIQAKERDKIKKEDIAKSLLVMICFHIAQLAYLVCKQNSIKKVYFFGNFTRRYSYAIEWLNYATKFWDKSLSIRFNLYDGNLGSIGTLINY